MKTVISVLAVLSLSACMDLAHAAEAATPDLNVRQQLVSYGDLNVHLTNGVSSLYTRIKSAADTVCEMPNMRALGHAVRYQKCMSYAITRAVSDVGSPELTQFHLARTPQVLPLNAQVSRATAKVSE